MGALSDGEAEGRPAFRLGRGDATGDAHAGLAGTGTSSSGRTRHLGLGLAGLRPRPSTALSVSRCSCSRVAAISARSGTEHGSRHPDRHLLGP